MNRPLIIFEMAQNHQGDIDHGKLIINEFAKLASDYNDTFDFAMKFQLRNLETFIHPDYKNRMDVKYVKRFTETRLSKPQFTELVQLAEDMGFFIICTGFDEESVDTIQELEFDYIKIASCSLTDWPLLNHITKTNIPIIASTAGSTLDEIGRVVSFFKHRHKEISLLHCMGEYPTPLDHGQLNQIDLLRKTFPGIKIGWSTHEEPSQMLTSALALAKGVDIIEKHVAVKTEKYEPNAYSITPETARFWLASCKVALGICGINDERHTSSPKEIADLRQFRRGVFAKRYIKSGETISQGDVFYAWPVGSDGVVANEMSKYVNIVADVDIPKNGEINHSSIRMIDTRAKVWDIVQDVKSFIQKTGVVFPGNAQLEISHHYGIRNFYKTGITMLTVVNRGYCKKIIVVLPGQEHPEQYHVVKEETFMILYGKLTATIDHETKVMEVGDIVTIPSGANHSFKSDDGCVIEELSTTHNSVDSFYTDPLIQENKNRKTIVNYWL